MKRAMCVIMWCVLCSCSQALTRRDLQWEEYRAEVAQNEASGVLTPTQAQARLRDVWFKLYGKDPDMAGFFAYSETLLRSAEEGQLSLAEAKQLVEAREQMVWAEHQAAQNQRRTNVS